MTTAPEQAKLPPTSLIICTRNRDNFLMDAVQAIVEANQTPTEIIIIDQSDRPSTSFDHYKTSIDCMVRYVWTKDIGSSHARNVGISLAKYDIVACIDDDMIVTPDWYQVLIQTLVTNGQKTVVTGRIEAAPSDKPHGFVIAVHTWKDTMVYEGRIGKDILATGLMAMYRSAYQEIGGLDEELGPGTRFPGAEDNDLGFRLLEAGYKIIYAADCVVYHRAWRNKRDYIPLFWSYGRGQGAFYAKHRAADGPYMRSRMKKDFLRFIQLAPQRLIHGQLLVLSGSAAFILGEGTGALDWSIRHRNR